MKRRKIESARWLVAETNDGISYRNFSKRNQNTRKGSDMSSAEHIDYSIS